MLNKFSKFGGTKIWEGVGKQFSVGISYGTVVKYQVGLQLLEGQTGLDIQDGFLPGQALTCAVGWCCQLEYMHVASQHGDLRGILYMVTGVCQSKQPKRAR